MICDWNGSSGCRIGVSSSAGLRRFGIQCGIGQPFGTYTAPNRSGGAPASARAPSRPGTMDSRNGSATAVPSRGARFVAAAIAA